MKVKLLPSTNPYKEINCTLLTTKRDTCYL